MIRLLESELPTRISPRALWTIQRVSLHDAELAVVEVPEGVDKPYVIAGAIYLRRNRSTQPASRREITGLIRKGAEAAPRWERQVALGAERADIDDELVSKTARLAIESGRWQGDAARIDADGFLRAMGLLSDGEITNACLLLFGKEPTRLLPQARVRLLVMPEGKTGARYDDDKLFEGCLLRVAEQIPEALAARIRLISDFSGEQWQRGERPAYPLAAVREGVMNALVHRDYQLSGSILISIQPDSLQVVNPGGLPNELTPADLKKDHLSVPRNPDVAHICYLHRLIEKVGRGTQRIIEDCRNADLREPRWQTSQLQTKLTLFGPGEATGTSVEDLNERQQKILGLVRSRASLSSPEIAALVGGVTERTIRNDLQGLVDRGWLVRRGRGRASSYLSAQKEQP